ncbi:hypothetical protein Tco_0375418 [Tanacetum coccineum]
MSLSLVALGKNRGMLVLPTVAKYPSMAIAESTKSLPKDERPAPRSYSVEDAELINDNRIPINAYSEAFLCHMGISRNYFQSLEEVPTFIGDDGWEMDLFSVVHLNKPKLVTEGVGPLREGEEPLMEATAGRTMELVLDANQPEDVNTMVEEPVPLRSIPDSPRLFVPCGDVTMSSRLLNSEECAAFVDNVTPPGHKQMLDEMPVNGFRCKLPLDLEIFGRVKRQILCYVVISHGLRLAAMCTLESQEVKQVFGDIDEVGALARGSGYNKDHATENAEAEPDYFLKPDVAQLQVLIFARSRDILNLFALDRDIP